MRDSTAAGVVGAILIACGVVAFAGVDTGPALLVAVGSLHVFVALVLRKIETAP